MTLPELAVVFFAGLLILRWAFGLVSEAQAEEDTTLSMDWWKDYYAKVVRQRVELANGARFISVRPSPRKDD